MTVLDVGVFSGGSEVVACDEVGEFDGGGITIGAVDVSSPVDVSGKKVVGSGVGDGSRSGSVVVTV